MYFFRLCTVEKQLKLRSKLKTCITAGNLGWTWIVKWLCLSIDAFLCLKCNFSGFVQWVKRNRMVYAQKWKLCNTFWEVLSIFVIQANLVCILTCIQVMTYTKSSDFQILIISGSGVENWSCCYVSGYLLWNLACVHFNSWSCCCAKVLLRMAGKYYVLLSQQVLISLA